MKSAGIVVKASSPKAVALAVDMARWLKRKGVRVYVEDRLSKAVKAAESCQTDELKDNIGLLIVLGGDGTMLYGARIIGKGKVPILGVNLGGLGFLTAVTMDEVYPLLTQVLKGDFTAEERMTLSVELKKKGKAGVRHRVLNDAVIKGSSAKLIRLETRINREYVTTYRCDGLIVATPTGSTAYSLSASGPVLYPTIHSIIVSPVCPFNLTNRPVVIPDWMIVEVSIPDGAAGVMLALDGQFEAGLEGGDLVTVKRAKESVYLIRYEGKGYFDILRERLMWEAKAGR
ncbi:MAG: NAD(+)/NADH kinase [Deltaproteobacteria bacterium]|nr:NAD(+)/NADH kinase [Deltaproteobacteria bacterium]